MNLEEVKRQWNKETNTTETPVMDSNFIPEFIRKQNVIAGAKVLIPEIIILGLYIYIAVFLTVFFYHYDTFLYKWIAIVCLTLLTVQSGLIITAGRVLRNKLQVTKNYISVLRDVKKDCKKLSSIYRFIMVINFVILLLAIILIPRVYSEELSAGQIFAIYLIGSIILSCFSIYIFRFYLRLSVKNNLLRRKVSIDYV